MKKGIIWIVITVLVCSCSHYRQIETDLYFGLSKPGGMVSPDEWVAFSKTELSRIFPAGYSELDAHGKWRGGGDSLLSEPSKLVIVIHEKNKNLDKLIDSACMAYKKSFQQEAVLRVDKRVKMKLN